VACPWPWDRLGQACHNRPGTGLEGVCPNPECISRPRSGSPSNPHGMATNNLYQMRFRMADRPYRRDRLMYHVNGGVTTCHDLGPVWDRYSDYLGPVFGLFGTDVSMIHS
jgi:hypothetical protein